MMTMANMVTMSVDDDLITGVAIKSDTRNVGIFTAEASAIAIVLQATKTGYTSVRDRSNGLLQSSVIRTVEFLARKTRTCLWV